MLIAIDSMNLFFKTICIATPARISVKTKLESVSMQDL